MKTMISFLISSFVVLAMAIPAEAQYPYRGYSPRAESIYGALYGGETRQPYYVRDLYPDAPPYTDPRMSDPCYTADQYWQGMRGNMHVEKGAIHFRPCDPTNGRTTTMGGGALAGLGGAAIGSTFGGRKGAAIGVVGGSIVGGIIASRRVHDNCIVVGPSASQPMAQPTVQHFDEPVSYMEPVSQPVEIPLERKLVRNRFENASVRVYDGSTELIELGPGAEDEIEVASSAKIWGEAYLENPKSDRREWVPLQSGRGIDELPYKAGWVFGNPNSRPSL